MAENYLITELLKHNLPTIYQAQFYGMPNGYVLLIYARSYRTKRDLVGIEYVICHCEDFLYDKETDAVWDLVLNRKSAKAPHDILNKFDQRLNELKTSREARSYDEAFKVLLDLYHDKLSDTMKVFNKINRTHPNDIL